MSKVKMTGITKRGDSYSFTVSMGYDMNGKQLRKYHTYKPPIDVTEKQAEKLALKAYFEFEKKCKGNKNLKDNMRLHELGDEYFEVFAPSQLKDSTTYNYRASYETHIKPRFGNTKLKDIETSDISTFLVRLEVKDLTKKKIKVVFHSIFNFAVTQGYIKENAVKGAIWGSNKDANEKRLKNFLTFEQSLRLEELTSQYSTFDTIIRLILRTGMRSGEVLGLMWGDINFDDQTIRIDKTLSYTDKRYWYTDTPKATASWRKINFDDTVKVLLLNHREEQDKLKSEFGRNWGHPEMVFTSKTGHYYDRSLLNAQFRRFVKNNIDDFPNRITVHGLRHTFCSLQIMANTPIEKISKALGHTSALVTSSIYSHMLEESSKSVSDAIHGLLNLSKEDIQNIKKDKKTQNED